MTWADGFSRGCSKPIQWSISTFGYRVVVTRWRAVSLCVGGPPGFFVPRKALVPQFRSHQASGSSLVRIFFDNWGTGFR